MSRSSLREPSRHDAPHRMTTMETVQRALPKYRLLSSLGRGGMAEVFLALSTKGGFNKLLVLKVMKPELAREPEFRRMFHEEANIAARLNHPNVIHTYEVGEVDDVCFIAMEYLEGQSFSDMIQSLGYDKFPLPIALRIVSDALLGLQYAHELSDFDGTPMEIIHRDVSPQNIFVTYGGHSKIVDFGIAKIAASPSHTQTGIIKGKTGYMAPEQITNVPLDRRADIYATGVVLWELLARRKLVARGDDEMAAMVRRMSGQDPNVREVAIDAPEEIVAICERAMAREGKDRYATALEMRREIEAYLTKVGGVDATQVARLLEDQFQGERSKVRRLIEEHIRLAQHEPDPSSDPEETSVRKTAFGPKTITDGTRSTHAERRNRLLILAMASVAAVMLGLGLVSILRPRGPEPRTIPPIPTPPVEPVTIDEAASQRRLRVRTIPTEAAVTLDGKPIAQPVDLPIAEGPHLLEVRAPGYVTQARVVGEQNADLIITLEAEPKAVTAPRVDPPKRPPPNELPRNRRTNHPIDDEDPYKK